MASTGSHNQGEAKPSLNLQIKRANYRKNGKNNLQLDTSNPPPLQSLCSYRLYYLMLT
jgi:hypothetical protein